MAGLVTPMMVALSDLVVSLLAPALPETLPSLPPLPLLTGPIDLFFILLLINFYFL